MEDTRRTYVPAAGHDWALPLYDPLVKLLGADRARAKLAGRAGIQTGHRVLDVGCGTGTLAILVKRLHPDVDVVGLDPDPNVLDRARRKADRAGVSVRFDRGFSDELPYAEGSFDRAFSTFMLHHLEAEEKERTLREVRRVLRPGGSLLLLDFGGSDSGAEGSVARWLHFSHGCATTPRTRSSPSCAAPGSRIRRRSAATRCFLGSSPTSATRLSCRSRDLPRVG